MAAVPHHRANIVACDPHKVSYEGMSQAVTRPAVRLFILELSQTSGSHTGPCYGVIKRNCRGAREYEGAATERRIGAERFRLSKSLSNASADDSIDSFAKRHVTLILSENSPARVLFDKITASAYQWHNYGKTTIGARSDVENVKI